MRTPRRCPFFVDGLPLYRPCGADRPHDDWIDFLADSHARYARVSGRRLYAAAELAYTPREELKDAAAEASAADRRMP